MATLPFEGFASSSNFEASVFPMNGRQESRHCCIILFPSKVCPLLETLKQVSSESMDGWWWWCVLPQAVPDEMNA